MWRFNNYEILKELRFVSPFIGFLLTILMILIYITEFTNTFDFWLNVVYDAAEVCGLFRYLMYGGRRTKENVELLTGETSLKLELVDRSLLILASFCWTPRGSLGVHILPCSILLSSMGALAPNAGPSPSETKQPFTHCWFCLFVQHLQLPCLYTQCEAGTLNQRYRWSNTSCKICCEVDFLFSFRFDHPEKLLINFFNVSAVNVHCIRIRNLIQLKVF